MSPFRKSTFACILLLWSSLGSMPAHAVVLFTYQGQLTVSGVPADGSFDFFVQIFDDVSGGTELTFMSALSVPVDEGVFTLQLDAPDGILDVDPWLQLQVRPAGSGSYTALAPRQPLSATPQAHRAFSVDDGSVTGDSVVDGSIGFSDINSGQVQVRVSQGCATGFAVRTINADGSVICQSAGVDAAWALGGNAGTTAGLDFLGTTDNEPLELHVNDRRALRLSWETSGGGSDGPSIVGGNPSNSIAAGGVGSVIAGGGTGGAPNVIQGEYNFIGGGSANQAIGGWSTIAGGSNNGAGASWAFVGGGVGNEADGNFSAVPGGQGNRAAGTHSIALGQNAKAVHDHTFVFNDGGSNFSSTSASQFLIDVSDGVGIGQNNPTDLLHVSAPAGRNALRVQVDGITRLRVHDNGGVSVGVNATPPAGGLLVDGDIELRNEQTRWATFAANAFAASDSRTRFFALPGRVIIYEADGSVAESVMAAPLHLPHGAVITGIRAVVLDADVNEDLRVEVTRREISGDLNSTEIVEVFTTTSSGSLQALRSSSVTEPVVDNQNYSYSVEIDTTTGNEMQLQVYNVRVSYTVDTVLP